MDNPSDEVRLLRRSLRDIVAMTMLPSVWTGYDAAQICSDLVDVVLRAVDADAVRLTSQKRGIDVLRLRDGVDEGTGRLLRDVSDETKAPGPVQLLAFPLAAGTDDRLVAVSLRDDFPNEMERVLLRVAANQAAMWIARKDTEGHLADAERTSRFLAEAGETLGRSLDYEMTLNAVRALAVPRVGDWCFVDLIEPDRSSQRIAVAHADPAAAPLAARLQRALGPQESPFRISRTFAAGTTTVENDLTAEALTATYRDEDHRAALAALNVRSFVSVPMTSRGRTFGVITFLRTPERAPFSPADVAMAEELARRVALAVDNARLYREAQEANRAKDEFLANLSHELRTPMTAIIGWAHLLQIGGLEGDEVDVGLATIRQSAQAQAQLIDELLDVSRIITGKMHLNVGVVSVPDTMRAALSAIRPASEAKRQVMEVLLPDEDLRVSGDAARLQQVFWNLLSNAVKFTPSGGSIRVEVAREESMVKVSVEDTGEGIAAEFLPLVFERFRQVTTSARRRTGLGLGLAIARELVDLHGGSITAESEGPNRGTTFTVTLPLHVERADAAKPVAVAADRRRRLHAMRVLLVEDDETTRKLFDTLLRSFGAEVMVSSSAAEARHAIVSFRPDLLISDIGLPGEDGVALLHSLRTPDQREFPAIAVTAFADETSRERVLAAGFDGFLSKPLDPLTLADEIERAVQHRRALGA